MLVADALYAFAQSAEAREADLKARAAAAEALACRERANAERRALALSEAEGLVGQASVVGDEGFGGKQFKYIYINR